MIFKKKIFFLTGKKGGYTSLLPLLKKIQNDKNLYLKVIATDQHTQAKFGNTFKQCQRDLGKNNIKVVKFKANTDTSLKRTLEMSNLLRKITFIFFREKPDMLILYGDRLESLIAAISATNLDIPICHFQGGDVSGNIDEKIRHSLTKLSDLHLTSNVQSLKRVLKMGENKKNCFNIGDSHIDSLKKVNISKKNFLEIKKKYNLKNRFVIFMLHPEGHSSLQNAKNCKTVLEVLIKKKFQIIAIYPCTDAGYKGIIDVLNLLKKKFKNLKVYKNIPFNEYICMLKKSIFLIGNSSSGIIESSYLKLPTINLGDRQNNRLKTTNVINSTFHTDSINNAIKKVTSKNFKNNLRQIKLYYGDGQSYKKAYKIIKSKLKKISTKKIFVDKNI